MPSKSLRPLWRCPKCGERFVTRKMWHSCKKRSLKALFARSEPQVFQMFKKFAKTMRAYGPVRVIAQKTRVVFQERVRFAACMPRKSYLLCALALPQRYNHPRFLEITTYPPRFHGHYFRVDSVKDLDPQVQRWMRKAYTVGEQRHLQKRLR